MKGSVRDSTVPKCTVAKCIRDRDRISSSQIWHIKRRVTRQKLFTPPPDGGTAPLAVVRRRPSAGFARLASGCMRRCLSAVIVRHCSSWRAEGGRDSPMIRLPTAQVTARWRLADAQPEQRVSGSGKRRQLNRFFAFLLLSPSTSLRATS